MNNSPATHRLLSYVRLYIAIIITGLFVSGVTAFPLETELHWLSQHSSGWPVALQHWLITVHHAISNTNQQYPYLSYGTDWLAFAHLVLALLFVGPLQSPVKNIWVIRFGIMACVLIFPLAFIAGAIRGIPVFWRMIDCSFGIIALPPLLLAYRYTVQLQALQQIKSGTL